MIGERLGARYRITAELGQGGMAAVYLAVDEVLNREVAVKIIHAHLARDSEFCHRFKQEASIAAKLEHPNIVKIYDYGEDESGRGFIVSEVIRGRNLHKIQLGRMKQHKGPFHPLIVAMIGHEVLEALACAHAMNYIHRDVKPDNVIIDRKGHVKLADFGIAKSTSSSMTVAGQYLGSPSYSSPEQVQGGNIDFRSDLFSVGVVLYEALTNHLPFTGKTASEVMFNIARGEHPSPTDYNPQLPAALVSIIEQSLEADPDRRLSSTPEMMQRLAQFLASHGIASARSGLEDYAADPIGFFDKMAKQSLAAVQELDRAPAPRTNAPPPPPASFQRNTQVTRTTIARPRDNTTIAFYPTSLRQTQRNKPKESQGFDLSAKRTTVRSKRARTGALHQHTRTLVTPVYVPVARRTRPPLLSVPLAAGFAFVFGILLVLFLRKPTEDSRKDSPVAASRVEESVGRASEVAPLETAPVSRPVESKSQVESPRPIKPASKMTSPSRTRSVSGSTRFTPAVQAPEPTPKAPSPPPRETLVRKEATDSRSARPRRQLQVARSGAPEAKSPSASLSKLMLKTVPGGLPILINGIVKPPVERTSTSQVFELPPGKSTVTIRDTVVGETRYQGIEKDIYISAGETFDLGLLRLVPLRKLRLKIDGPGVIATINGDPYALRDGELVLERPEGSLAIDIRAANGKSLTRSIELKNDDFTLEASLE